MQSDHPSTAEDLFAHYLALRESGDDTPFERFVDEHAEFRNELLRLADGWDQFESVFDSAVRRASSTLFFRRGQATLRPHVASRLASVELEPGSEIGEFTLMRMLAEGGMGQVWEAHQKALDRRVALKFIRPDCADPEAFFLFEREARAGGRIQHPCAVAVYATGEAEGVPWIAQELVEGGYSFDDFLRDVRQDDALPERYFQEVARFLIDIADVLQVAHDAGVIHRDIKPGNVLVSPDDRPKLTDFGLARLIDDDRRSDPMALRGTPYYMSPEQVMCRAVGPRAEVFSFGAMMYEALTLRRAFDGDSRGKIFERIKDRDPEPPSDIDARVPRDLSTICMKCLAKVPEARYASMREVADDLGRFLSARPIEARPIGAVMRTWMWARRHPAASAAAGLGVALLVAVGAVGAVWSASRDEVLARDVDEALLRVELALEADDLAGAEEMRRRALEFAPDDPRVHLVMAQGYARFGMFNESEDSAQRAVELGFEPVAEGIETALEHYRYGLFLAATGKFASHAEAESHLARAVELDPTLAGAYYPLYLTRNALGRTEEALDAVLALRGRIGQAEPFYPVVDALAMELEGDVEDAIALLESLAVEHAGSPEMLAALRLHRSLGRCYLRVGDLERAEQHLRAATAERPVDGDSWLNLASVRLSRYEEEDYAGDKSLLLDEAASYVERGGVWDDDRPAVRAYAAIIEVRRLGLAFGDGSERVPTEVWSRTTDALDALEKVDADDPFLAPMRAHVEFLRGAGPDRSGSAVEHFARAIEHNPLHVPARVLLAQERWFEGDRDSALSELQQALATWDEPEGSRSVGAFTQEWPEKWLLAIHVWTFGSAAYAAEWTADIEKVAREARDRIEETLALQSRPDATEIYNYCEFLVLPQHEELRDCARALELIEAHGLEADVDLGALAAKLRAECGG